MLINKRKVRAGILINVFDKVAQKAISKITAYVRVSEKAKYQKKETYLIAQSYEPVLTVDDEIILHYEKKEENLTDEMKVNYAERGFLKNIKNDALIVTFLNGVGHFEKLSVLCDNEISQGVIYILSHIKSPGVIRKKGKVFAAVFAEDKKGILKEIFKKSSLRYKISSDITKDIWKKYIFISAFANLTSYYDKSIYEVYNQHTTQTKEVLCEIAKIAKAKGINIDEEVEKSLKTASSLPKDASTSMHKDFKNSKKTELEALSGYLVNEAKRLNINIPQISKIYAKLKMKS